MLDFVWDFLRDEQNREALKIVGAMLAALGVAGWAIFRELRTARQIADLAAQIERLTIELDRTRASQADMLRDLARTEERHNLLFGVMVGRVATTAIRAESNEPPEAP